MARSFFAFRSLTRQPAFTLAAAATLALGIGATTATFSIVHTVVRPLPYAEPDRLVKIWGSSPTGRFGDVSLADFADVRDQNHVFKGVAADDGHG